MVQASWRCLGVIMEEIKASKKVQYAIRMMDWHSKLARRNYDIVKEWLDSNNLDFNADLMNYIEKKKKKENENQLTIFDFL